MSTTTEMKREIRNKPKSSRFILLYCDDFSYRNWLSFLLAIADMQGKQHLKSLEKYYAVDMGLRQLLLGNRRRDIGHIFENIVYLELVRRGYHVSIGKVGELEVDFVAERSGETAYYQVSATVMSEDTFDREIAPLKRIRDNYPKYIITMDEMPMDEDGIKIINVIDFLLKS